jgi:hypothetical protein
VPRVRAARPRSLVPPPFRRGTAATTTRPPKEGERRVTNGPGGEEGNDIGRRLRSRKAVQWGNRLRCGRLGTAAGPVLRHRYLPLVGADPANSRELFDSDPPIVDYANSGAAIGLALLLREHGDEKDALRDDQDKALATLVRQTGRATRGRAARSRREMVEPRMRASQASVLRRHDRMASAIADEMNGVRGRS